MKRKIALTLGLAAVLAGTPRPGATQDIDETSSSPQTSAETTSREEAANDGSDRRAIETITTYGTRQQLSSFNVDEASTATRIDLPIRDTPVSIQVVPRSVIDSQGGVVLEDAIRNVSGVQPDLRNNAILSNTRFLIRGFQSQAIYVNGMPTFASGTVDLENTQRVEVLKGPASILYGLVEPGGLINVVTKKPQWSPSYSVQQQFASYDFYRTTFDLTGPLSDEVAFRLTGGFTDAGSFRDFITTERYAIAPSIGWRPTEDTEIIFEGSFNQTRTPLDSGVAFSAAGQPVAPISTFLGSPFLPPAKIQDAYARYMLRHQIRDNWSFRSMFDYHYFGNDSQTLAPLGDTQPGPTPEEDFVFEFLNRRKQRVNVYQLVNDTQIDLEVGLTEHKVLVGLDLRRRSWKDEFQVGFVPPVEQPIVNPVYEPLPDFIFTDGMRDLTQDWLGVYIQDAIAVLPSERVRLLLGGRFDAVDSEGMDPGVTTDPNLSLSDTAFTGRAGLLVDVIDGLGVYGSVSESFEPSTVGQLTRDGSTLEPETGIQYEVGAKGELPGGALATLALYELVKDDVAVADPDFPGFFLNGGKQRSRGLEIDIVGELLDGWNLIASYAYTKTRVLASDVFTPGDPLRNVPEHAGSFWTTYVFDDATLLDGLTLGAGVFASSSRAGDNRLDFTLPGFASVDFLASYGFEAWQSLWIDVQLNVRNAFDEVYYASSQGSSRVEPAAPQTFLGTLRFRY